MNRLATLTAAVFGLAFAQHPAQAAEAGKKPVKAEARKVAETAKPQRVAMASREGKAQPQRSPRVPVADVGDADALRAALADPGLVVSPAQLEIAGRVLTGLAECELNQTVRVEPQPDRPGHFRVAFRNVAYNMVPEETTTGAIRLYDARADVVWLQIPTKSMLMNARVGQRVVDACMQTEQRIAASAPASMRAASGLGWSTPVPAMPALASSLALPAAEAAAPMQPVAAIAATMPALPAADLGALAAAPDATAAVGNAAVTSGATQAASGTGDADAQTKPGVVPPPAPVDVRPDAAAAPKSAI